jgi:hypothetical protein
MRLGSRATATLLMALGLLIAVGGIVLIALVSTWVGGLVAFFGAGVAWSGRAISKQSREPAAK